MSCGIYKITNKINGKIYIGQSKNIEQRWIHHKYESLNEKFIQYNYTIHRAFRKYGIDNFDFQIIELTENLFEREKYWISFYNSYKNGYNETPGGDSGPSLPGESNPNAKLTAQDVFEIRNYLLEDNSQNEIYKLFEDKISFSQFSRIWRGEGWSDVCPEAITYAKSKEYLSKVRAKARMSRCSEEQKKNWEDIKNRKQNGEDRLLVYEMYKNLYSLSGFNKIWYKK